MSSIADAGAADPSDEPDGCPTGGTGSLDVQISGTSEPDAFAVTIEGVDERVSERLTSTTYLRLPSGRYHVLADTVTAPAAQGQDEALVRRVFVPSVAKHQVCVRDDATTSARITYGSLNTAGALFIAHADAEGQVARLDLPSKGLSRSSVDTFDVKTPVAHGLAFDVAGNLWIAGDGVVERIPAANLVRDGGAAADIEITGALFTGDAPGPTALAFDREGDLWVSLPGAKKIVELPAWSLAASGAPRPTVVIDGASFEGLDAMAFDDNGDLFVASGDHVLRFAAGRLASSTSAPPDSDVTVQGLAGIRDLAFDVAGDLWVAYAGSNVVARLERGELAGAGARVVAPKIAIELATSGVLDAIAFDEAGGMWLGYGPAKLGRLTHEQLSASATVVTPAQIVEGIRLGTASRLAFFPGPKGSPLYSAVP